MIADKRHAKIVELMKRLTSMLDGEDFHGFSSEVWRLFGEAYDAGYDVPKDEAFSQLITERDLNYKIVKERENHKQPCRETV